MAVGAYLDGAMLTLMVFVVAVVCFFPQTPLGRMLRRALVEWPAEKIAQVGATTLLLVVLLFLACVLPVAIAGREALLPVAQTLPEGIAWLVTFDVGTYVDVLALAWLLGGAARLRASVRTCLAALKSIATRLPAMRVGRHSRTPRSRPTSGSREPQADEDRWWGAVAA